MPVFNAVDLIITKRDGHVLEAAAIKQLVDAYTQGEVPDYQMSAFLMAAFLRGLNAAETAALTDAMLHSGAVLDLSEIPGLKVDKHSTGGVGDKVSLILAPIVAACGVPVPMISGRGLGHTGGTLDKLASIPGFRVDLSIPEYRAQLEAHGLVMIGQTAEIAPADRKLYALRDVTGTVEFIPFIAASIMSKKLAEGIDALVLDVKCGRGAFMQTEADARALAETLVHIGEGFGKRTVAWMTRMDAPLGYAIGNWPEVVESIRCLRGGDVSDVMEVTLTLAAEMLHLGGVAESTEAGRRAAAEAVSSGRAFDKLVEMVEAQGGDPAVLHEPASRADVGLAAEVLLPESTGGYVTRIDALRLGQTAVAMGAGRKRKEDPVDPTAGIVLTKKRGDLVHPGDPLALLYTRRAEEIETFKQAVRDAYSFSTAPPEARAVLIDRYSTTGWTNPEVPVS